MRIDICICTYRRPHIALTLASLDRLRLPDHVRPRVIVIDNDDRPTARPLVTSARLPVVYIHHPGANIALARNAALDRAEADWLAFLDDDETADPGWLEALITRQVQTGADAVFGPSLPVYPAKTPRWIRRGAVHAQHPRARHGEVETGHTCNALLRWGGTRWQTERFDPARGRTGGEDTEFFFRLHRLGAQFAIAPDAVVREVVTPDRLTLRWLVTRRFRAGQTYAARALNPSARVRLCAGAAAKTGIAGLLAVATAPLPHHAAGWLLRAVLQAGICAGCLGMRQPRLYGAPPRTMAEQG